MPKRQHTSAGATGGTPSRVCFSILRVGVVDSLIKDIFIVLEKMSSWRGDQMLRDQLVRPIYSDSSCCRSIRLGARATEKTDIRRNGQEGPVSTSHFRSANSSCLAGRGVDGLVPAGFRGKVKRVATTAGLGDIGPSDRRQVEEDNLFSTVDRALDRTTSAAPSLEQLSICNRDEEPHAILFFDESANRI